MEIMFLTNRSSRLSSVILAISFFFIGISHGMPEETAVQITNSGKTSFQIVISPDASPSEQYASRQLQYFLKEISGVALSIVQSDLMPSKSTIFVGSNKALDLMGVNIDYEELGDEGYVIRTMYPHLILVGGKKRGTLYAVYGLLEDHLGCRWYAPDVSKIPQRQTLLLPEINEQQIPAFEYRDILFTDFRKYQGYALRNRTNGGQGKLDAGVGGAVKIFPFVHSMVQILPVKKYYDTHPEYFAMYGGKRIRRTDAFPCFSNPAVKEIFIETISKWIEEHENSTIIDISQGDGAHGMCNCPKCEQMRRNGNNADLLITFLNEIIEKLLNKYPGRKFITLAYNATRPPPTWAKPHPSLIVRLCTKSRFVLSNEDALETREIIDWCQKVQKVYIWEYATGFGHYWAPRPNIKYLSSIIRFYNKVGVDGIMTQGPYQLGLGGGEFVQLRQWLISKLMWNPKSDVDALIDEFMRDYYGKAAPIVREYFDLIHGNVAKSPERNDFLDPEKSFLSDEDLHKSLTLFDRAESLAETESIKLRVHEARLPLEYTAMQRAFLHYRIDDCFVESPWLSEVKEHTEVFCNGVKKCGRDTIYEVPVKTRHIDAFTQKMENRIVLFEPIKQGVVVLKNNFIKIEILPGVGGKVISMKLKDKPDYEFLRQWQLTDDEYGQRSGIEQAAGRDEFVKWTSPGRTDSFEVIFKTEEKLHLRFKLSNGLIWTKKYFLDKKRPILYLDSSIINPTKIQHNITIETTAVFAADVVSGKELFIFKDKNNWKTIEIAEKGRRQGWIDGEEWPGQAWLTGDSNTGHGIVNRIDSDFIEGRKYFYCWWDTGENAVRMAHVQNYQKLLPGDEYRLQQNYELLIDYRKVL